MKEPHVIDPLKEGEDFYLPLGRVNLYVGDEWVASLDGLADPVLIANFRSGHAALSATDEDTFRAQVRLLVHKWNGLPPNEGYTPDHAYPRYRRSHGFDPASYDITYNNGAVHLTDDERRHLDNPAPHIDRNEIFLDDL